MTYTITINTMNLVNEKSNITVAGINNNSLIKVNASNLTDALKLVLDHAEEIESEAKKPAQVPQENKIKYSLVPVKDYKEKILSFEASANGARFLNKLKKANNVFSECDCYGDIRLDQLSYLMMKYDNDLLRGSYALSRLYFMNGLKYAYKHKFEANIRKGKHAKVQKKRI